MNAALIVTSLLLLDVALSAFSADQYAVKFTMQDMTTGILGFDGTTSARSRFQTQGRASAVVMTTQSRTSSYPVSDLTYQIQRTNASDGSECDNLLGGTLLNLFDFSSKGWLFASGTVRSPVSGGGWIYIGALGLSDAILMSADQPSALQVPYNVSLLLDSSGVPTSLNVSSVGVGPVGDVAQMYFSHFEWTISRMFKDRDFAPPPNDCFLPDLSAYPNVICAGNPVKTVDIYRTHDNDTWATILSQENGADATGEAYFLSQLTPHPFITHFKVDINTSWTPYCECNRGYCPSYVQSLPQNYAEMISLVRGVGREEGLGGVQRMDGTGQCDPPGTVSPQGYWYSFPIIGECLPHHQVGDNNCTWAATRVKTITLSCAQAMMNGSTPAQQGAQLVQAFSQCPSQTMHPHD